MHLKKLGLAGFKSFAHKTDLIFTRGITAVVGPNGSGKSNIADAIRWVMGEQSVKTLRGKKSEDVIFSGSDKKGRLGMAEVSLELDNSEKKVPLDYAELAITRRLYRSGESDYLINGGKSKLADINLLLTQANFGHRTYAVIGQGMIDNFLIATPQERKDFFEEASGVKQYQIKKNQALNKLEAVFNNVKTVTIQIEEMEPQLKLLTRQVKKLEKRKEIEQELVSTRLQYYSAYWQEIEGEYQLLQKKLAELDQERSKRQAIFNSLEKKFGKLAQKKDVNKKIDLLRQEQETLWEKKSSLKEELLKSRLMKDDSTLAQRKVQTFHQTGLEKIKRDLEEINAWHGKLAECIKRGDQADLLQKELLMINKKIREVLADIAPYLKEATIKPVIEEKDQQQIEHIKNLEGQIAVLDQKYFTLQEEIKKINAVEDAERAGLWQQQQDYQAAQRQLNEAERELGENRISLARIETKRFDLLREINYELGGQQNLSQGENKKLTDQEKVESQNKINRLKSQLEIIGGLDPEIQTEFESTKTRYDFLTTQISDLKNTMESLKKLVDELDKTIKKQIEKSFAEINDYFQKYFKILFQGGKAELVLVKEKELQKKYSADEAAVGEDGQKNTKNEEKTAINFFQEKSRDTYAGIEVEATPPGKKLKSVNALSGGERALTSIALICAIISANPSPFVVLDEVDAALDEANSIRFAEILANLSHKTQFVVITHNRATMEKAALLYGVTMGDDGISKLVSLKLEEAEKQVNR